MEKNKELEQAYVEEMIKNDLFAAIYPKDKSEESALKIANMIDSAAGIAEFKDENGESIYGVLIDKVKEAKKIIKDDEEK